MKSRNSAIECLRILCMLLIIAHHYSYHGGFAPISGENLNAGRLFVQMLLLFGKVPCGIFALITGYYMIDAPRKGHYKKALLLAGEMLFYSLGIFALMYFTKAVPVHGSDLKEALFPVIYGNWYAVYYFALFLAVPVINPALRSFSKKVFTELLAVVLLLWSVIPTFFEFRPEFWYSDFMLIMYCTGAWLKLFLPKNPGKKKYYAAVSLGCVLWIIGSTLFIDCLKYVRNVEITWLEIMPEHFYNLNSAITVLCAVFTFLWFLNMREFSCKPINRIAGTTFGIYLMHDNTLARQWIWNGVFPNADYVQTPYLHAAGKIFAVFLVCSAIDLIRKATAEKLFRRALDRFTEPFSAGLRQMIPREWKEFILSGQTTEITDTGKPGKEQI